MQHARAHPPVRLCRMHARMPRLYRIHASARLQVLDSDYSFFILAELTRLTSLSLTYTTWPLSLAASDMSLLAPLSHLCRCVHPSSTTTLLEAS